MSKDKKYKNRGFTLAEVLITLTIIGIIAAILFPSILANYNERTLTAKRQALFARMSQAMGEMADTFANYEDAQCTTPGNIYTCTDRNSALKFITEGLAKTYKVASICDKDSLEACDIPKSITKQDGTVIADFYSEVASFKNYTAGTSLFGDDQDFAYKDYYPAAFTTKNGESILLYINPTCSSNTYHASQAQALCVNMIYDLNGGDEKPNKMGEDIGVISSYYSGSPFVVMPVPVNFKKGLINEYTDASDVVQQEYNGGFSPQTAMEHCASMGDNVRVPTFEEMASILINTRLFVDPTIPANIFSKSHPNTSFNQPLHYWLTSSLCTTNNYKYLQSDYRADNGSDGGCTGYGSTAEIFAVMCVYDNQ